MNTEHRKTAFSVSLQPEGTDTEIMDLTPENIADYGVCGYKDIKKHLELRRKIEWFNTYYSNAILETARKMKIPAALVELDNAESAQNTPSGFGTFCILYKGEVISHHPISNTRFENIMKSVK